jgi:hypothetical protein
MRELARAGMRGVVGLAQTCHFHCPSPATWTWTWTWMTEDLPLTARPFTLHAVNINTNTHIPAD